MRRFFNLVLGALAMLIVAMVSAFLTMRLAIHGREVKVPNIAGLSLQDGSKKANSLGLRLNVENRFYSADTPAGNILAQSPAPGTTVRRAWTVRVTESLGPQQVSIPNVVGQSERTASINIRRLSLDLGTVASIAAPEEAGVVVAQTPNPNAVGVEQPRVSLLLSDATGSAPAFVMPSLTGLSVAVAGARASAAGLHVASVEEQRAGTTGVPTATSGSPSAAAATPVAPGTVAAPTATPLASSGTVVAQTPLAGHRVSKGDAVHLTFVY
jgi:eukaryotic-like serine/threonine-protein kinase